MAVRLFREPVLVFLLLGALIFLWEQKRLAPEAIVVDSAVIERLVEERELVLQRVLSGEERAAVRQSFIDQELLLREALRRDLHLADGRVRHRLADKMMFLLADEPEAPDVATLDSYHAKNRGRYMTERRVTLEHRFFGDDEQSAKDALRSSSESDVKSAEFFWLGDSLERMSAQDLTTVLGVEFARALEALPVGKWQGPMRSDRGWHVVRVLEWHEAAPIPREALDERLLREWTAEQRDRLRRQALDTLRAMYPVIEDSDA